jgi:hypothetical protein
MAFEEGGVDWMALAVKWDTDLEKVLVWYYDVDITAGENLTDEEMHLGITEGLDLDPLEFPNATEFQRWVKEARSA